MVSLHPKIVTVLCVWVQGKLCLFFPTSILAAPKARSVASFGGFIVFDPNLSGSHVNSIF